MHYSADTCIAYAIYPVSKDSFKIYTNTCNSIWNLLHVINIVWNVIIYNYIVYRFKRNVQHLTFIYFSNVNKQLFDPMFNIIKSTNVK